MSENLCELQLTLKQFLNLRNNMTKIPIKDYDYVVAWCTKNIEADLVYHADDMHVTTKWSLDWNMLKEGGHQYTLSIPDDKIGLLALLALSAR